MNDQGFKKAMLLLATAAVVLLALGVGFLMVHFSPAGEPPSAAPEPAVTVSVTAAAAPATSVAPVPDTKPAVSGTSPDPAEWIMVNNGCRTEQIGSRFHITGTTQSDSWNNFSGISTTKKYPEGEFTVSVDMMVPKYTHGGMGGGGAYLRVGSTQGSQMGIMFQSGVGYLMQAWTNPQQFSGPLQLFGDEGTTFHHLKVQYEAATQTATGWVDDRRIGSVHGPLTGELDFSLFINNNKAGSVIDLWYDHFEVVVPGADNHPAPAGAKSP